MTTEQLFELEYSEINDVMLRLNSNSKCNSRVTIDGREVTLHKEYLREALDKQSVLVKRCIDWVAI